MNNQPADGLPSGTPSSESPDVQRNTFDSVFIASFGDETGSTARPVCVSPEPVPTVAADPDPPGAVTSCGEPESSRVACASPVARDPVHGIPLLVLSAIGLLATLPMFVTHLRHLSHMPHRAHYSVVLLGFAAVVWRRWRGSSDGVNLNFRFVDVGLLGLAVATFAMSARLGSPWLCTLSLLLLAGLLLRRLPSASGEGFAGPWMFLFLLLPLPLGFDHAFVQSLQTFATATSSRLLDLCGVNHLVSGNVLELPGKQLFIDEACSGIQSVFAMVTCVALFACWTRRPPLLAIPLLAASVVMCTLVNILRIVLVVVAETRGLSLASGWSHEMLGATLFVVALVLVYCSEGFVLFLFAPVINPATGEPDDRAATWWNRLTASVSTVVYGAADPYVSEPVPAPVAAAAPHVPARLMRGVMFVATVLFAFFGLGQLGWETSAQATPSSSSEEAMLRRSASLGRNTLPAELASWRLASFERVRRSEQQPESVTWQYRSPYYKATVSLDYPFFGSHNVTDCYNLRGWKVTQRTTTAAGYSKATLNRPFGETALLYYDIFDAEGTVRLESPGGRLAERFRDYDGSRDRPTWQLQLIIQSDHGLTRKDLVDIEMTFQSLRSRLRAKVAGHWTDDPSGDQP